MKEPDKYTKSTGWKTKLIGFILGFNFKSWKDFHFIFDQVKICCYNCK